MFGHHIPQFILAQQDYRQQRADAHRRAKAVASAADRARRDLNELGVRLGHAHTVARGELGDPTAADVALYEGMLGQWRALVAATGDFTADEMARIAEQHAATVAELRRGAP